METWECHFQMDSPGASAVPSAGFSFGASLGIASSEVSEWLVKSQAARGSCDASPGWAEGGGDNAPGESQLPPRSCPEHSAEHFSHPSPCDATSPGNTALSLLLEQALTSKLRHFSSCYSNFQAFLCQAPLPSTWPGHLYALTIPVLWNGICGLLAMSASSSSSVTLLLHFHKRFKPA